MAYGSFTSMMLLGLKRSVPVIESLVFSDEYFVCFTSFSCLLYVWWIVMNKSVAITTTNLLFSFMLLIDESK
jgi:hypothetical protein